MESLQQNVRLYPLFRAAADGHAWIPVFFLYMNQYVALDQVIQLSAVYYLSVFILEVPSGYFSDRVGRRLTLLMSAAALVVSYSCFIFGDNFAWFAIAQFFLAAGIAFESGTDTSLLYDSLKGLEREHEYAAREANAEQIGLLMLALATLAGGALGAIDLRLAYFYALLSALFKGLLAWRFCEPRHARESSGAAQGFAAVVVSCLVRLRDPVLGWTFVMVIVLYALAHIVFEFYQPYITLLELDSPLLDAHPALVSGIVISVSMFGGALGARLSIPWQARFGFIGVLAIAMAIQLGIVAAMAAVLSPLVLSGVFARNFPMALVHAPVRAAIAPRITREQRATYLSIQGLSERLLFAMLLLGLSLEIEKGAPVDAPALSAILGTTLWLGMVCALGLFAVAGRIRRELEPGRAGA